VALAAAVVAAAAAALGTGAALAGETPSEEAKAWRTAFDRRVQVPLGKRMIVVLAAPSLADRAVEAGRLPAAKEQRRIVKRAETLQRRLLATLRGAGIEVRRDQVFTRTLNGFSAVLSPRAIAALQRMPGVAAIYPVRAVYPASLSAKALSRPELLGRHGVALPGFDGSGVTVALLDTGVDRDHPALRGHVLWGVDLVEGDSHTEPEPSPDGSGRLETHGTRIAGIVVGQGGPNGVTGVAPGVQLLPIRILGWHKDADGRLGIAGSGDVLIAGLERSVDPDGDGDVEDAADIALASVVEPYASFADSPEARAVAGTLALGTLVVAPAGNDGPVGTGSFGTVGAPAGAPAALAVGAADTRPAVTTSPLKVRIAGETLYEGQASVLGGVPPAGELALRALAVTVPTLSVADRPASSAATGESLGDFFDPSGKSLVAGAAAVLAADGTPVLPKVQNAADAGAVAVLVYGSTLPAGAAGLSEDAPIPVLAVTGETGQAIVSAGAAGAEVTIGRGDAAANPDVAEVTGFSSRGPAFGAAKPDVVASGVALATPDAGPDGNQGRYAAVSGTSVAAAVAAGGAALVMQARPDLDAATLRSVLVGSARLLVPEAAEPVTAQGAGLVDPAAAAAAVLAVEPATLSFDRASEPGLVADRTIEVKNLSTEPLDVSLGLATDPSAGAVLTFAADPSQATVSAGATAVFRLVVSAAAVEPPATVSGAVVVQAEGAAPARIPWTMTFPTGSGELLSGVALAPSVLAPSRKRPAVLAFRAGAVRDGGDGVVIEPVGTLDVELSTREGKVLGVVARLQDLLPGRYAIGFTGRGPDGKRLPPGRYVLTVRAWAADAAEGEAPATSATVELRIRRPAK
jgi:subtilisin family serine protease